MAPEGTGAGGDAPAAGDAAPAAGDAAPPTGEGNPPTESANPPTGEGNSPPAEAAAKPWWEAWDPGDAEVKNHFLNAGFHKGAETAEAALGKVAAAYRNSERKLGRSSDQLLELPGKDADRAEWRRANAAALDIPADAKGYAVEKPADYPEGLSWDEAEAASAAEAFAKLGVPRDMARALIAREVERRVADWNGIRQEIAEAQGKLRTKLTAEWGGQVQGNLNLAARAFDHFAALAKIPPESGQAVQRKLIGEGGVEDAQVVRLFHAIGRAMGEDGLALRELRGGGAGAGAMTPAEATARMGAITAAGGDYAKARGAGDRARMRELDSEISRLAKIAAEGKAA